jgi:hypothetical protein
MLLLMQIWPHREVDSKFEELQRCLELRYKIDVADLKLWLQAADGRLTLIYFYLFWI